MLNTTPNKGAIRVGDWKLVLNGGAQDEEDTSSAANDTKKPTANNDAELFNLATDPNEKENLAGQRPEKLKELRARYTALARQAVPPKNARGASR